MSDRQTSQTSQGPDHTVVILDSEDMDVKYILDGADYQGLHVIRIIDGEPNHSEILSWTESARMIRNHTMRIYGMQEEEVEDIE